MSMRTMLRRFVVDDQAQDLIEYALLCALIGIVGIIAWANVSAAIGTTYGAWDANAQAVSATTPDPIGP
jgi:Flp pilus assembly pilin Flp